MYDHVSQAHGDLVPSEEAYRGLEMEFVLDSNNDKNGDNSFLSEGGFKEAKSLLRMKLMEGQNGQWTMNEGSWSALGKKQPIYKCESCSFSSVSLANFDNHCKAHGANKKFTCDYCDFSQPRLNLLYQHMMACHPKEMAKEKGEGAAEWNSMEEQKLPFQQRETAPVKLPNGGAMTATAAPSSMTANYEAAFKRDALAKCSKCPFSNKDSKEVMKHIEMHGYMGKYSCQICDFSHDAMDQIIAHQSLHGIGKSDKIPFQSILRQKLLDRQTSKQMMEDGGKKAEKSSSEMLMEVSEGSSSINHDPLSAKSTDGEVDSTKTTTTTTTTAPSSKATSPTKKKLRCNKCPFVTMHKSNLLKHKKCHQAQTPLKCQHCDYSTTNANVLQSHIASHGIPEPEAEVQQQPQEQQQLPHHQQQEPQQLLQPLPKEQLCCEICPFSTEDQIELDDHVMCHGAAHKYKCTRCDFSTISHVQSEAHAKLHDDDEEGVEEEKAATAAAATEAAAASAITAIASKEEEAESEKKEAESKSVEASKRKSVELVSPQNNQLDYNGPAKRLRRSSSKASVSASTASSTAAASATSASVLSPPSTPRKQNEENVSASDPVSASASAVASDKFSAAAAADKQPAADGQPYPCPHCPFKTATRVSLNHHLTFHSPSPNRKHVCDVCGYSVDRLAPFQQHQRLHEKEEEEEEEEQTTTTEIHVKAVMKCPFCEFEEKSVEDLEAHVHTHLPSVILKSEMFKNVMRDTLAKQATNETTC